MSNAGAPPLYGLIGETLDHSFSPAYFAQKFRQEGIDADYKAFPLARIADLPALLQSRPDLCGLNVTVPYKQSVIPYLDSLDAHAAAIGAVNCIAFKEGKLIGYNTDWIGFWQSLQDAFTSLPAGALILGKGGAAAAVRYALKLGNIPFKTISRNPEGEDFPYEAIDTALLKAFPLLVQTTPLGTAPRVTDCVPVPYHLLTLRNLLFDLVYNPAQTRFLSLGAAQGCATQNGLAMLEIQAEESWKIWTAGRDH